MLDTGAQSSVVDRITLERMNLAYSVRQDQVYGVGKSPVPICGTLELEVDVGDWQRIFHRLEVLNTNVRTAILGRNFLANFSEVCFDVKGFRLKLGDYWKEAGFSVHGGQALERAEIMEVDSCNGCPHFDVNTEL